MIRENENYRILGAGLLSAPDEMEYAMSDCPNKPEFDPKILAKIQFDDTTLQELVKNIGGTTLDFIIWSFVSHIRLQHLVLSLTTLDCNTFI